jgi:AraC-like DNA-binding protein
MPVFQIAASLGFSSSEHIVWPFRQEKGMSPKEFRRNYPEVPQFYSAVYTY